MKTRSLIPITVGAALTALLALNACKTMPSGTKPVENFQKEKYLGKWYEIARFDSRFEKNLSQVTAEYRLNPDGKTIKVINQGYDDVRKQWKSVTGKAKFVGEDTVASLKVSFFGPFYGGYNVVAIDENYQYALVYGANRKYLWILSREKSIPEAVKQRYVAKAQAEGFAVENLVWVNQSP